VNDEQAVTYGREAAAVIGNRAYIDAYEAIEKALVDELARSDITAERAEQARLLLSLGRRYRKYLEKAMADGNFSAESIKLDEQQKKWWRNRAA
jgi:hypothetical protein